MFKREWSSAEKLLAIIVCLCFGFLLSSLVVGTLYGYMQEGASYKFLLILSSVISFGLPAFFIAKFVESGRGAFSYIGMTHSPDITKYALVVVFMFAIMPAIELISSLNALYSFPDSLSGLEEYFRNADARASQATQTALVADSFPMYILNLLAIAITPASCEEMFFRGILQNYFAGVVKNKHLTVLLTALIFSVVHLQFSGLLPRFILGAVIGYIYILTGSLWPSIVAHATNNMLVVSVAYFADVDVSQVPDLGSYANPWWIATLVSGLVVAVFTVWLFRKQDADE